MAGFSGPSLGILYLSRKEKLPWLRIHDYVACCVPFGLFFGRIANFVNHELWGAPTNVPWAIRFPEVVAGLNALGPPRHPTQLYEAMLEGVLLFAILAWMFWKTQARYEPGKLVGAFIFFYGVFRFGIEFVREPDAQLSGSPSDRPAYGPMAVAADDFWRPLSDADREEAPRANRADSRVGQRRLNRVPSLADRLRERIRAEGPISVEAYMAECNAHYYATRDPLGATGDFTTAPEISQMFGELVGACLADCWLRAGAPAAAVYAELGPGRGTLAADALRVMRQAGFSGTAHLCGDQPSLRAEQALHVPEPGFTIASRICRARRSCWRPTNSSTPFRSASGLATKNGAVTLDAGRLAFIHRWGNSGRFSGT